MISCPGRPDRKCAAAVLVFRTAIVTTAGPAALAMPGLAHSEPVAAFVMEILGHSQISMTPKYARVLPQVMTDAAERIGRALRGDS